MKLLEGLASEVNLVPHQRLHVPPGTVARDWAALPDMNLLAKPSGELMVLINKNNWPTV